MTKLSLKNKIPAPRLEIPASSARNFILSGEAQAYGRRSFSLRLISRPDNPTDALVSWTSEEGALIKNYSIPIQQPQNQR